MSQWLNPAEVRAQHSFMAVNQRGSARQLVIAVPDRWKGNANKWIKTAETGSIARAYAGMAKVTAGGQAAAHTVRKTCLPNAPLFGVGA